VDGAQLVIGIGEAALDQGQQATEVVGDQQQDPPQTAVLELDQDLAPSFQDFVAPEGGGGEEFLFALQAQAQDQEMDRRFDLVLPVFEFDDFGIGKEAEPVRGQGPAEERFGLLVEFLPEGFDLVGGVAQAQGLETATGDGTSSGLTPSLTFQEMEA
jgi:hypothetical protein